MLPNPGKYDSAFLEKIPKFGSEEHFHILHLMSFQAFKHEQHEK